MLRFIGAFGDPHTGIDPHMTIRAWNGLVLDRVDVAAAATSHYRCGKWRTASAPNALPR